MLVTNKAIWVIERNLQRDLTLAGLAAACDVSPFHLAHAFAEATGQPVMHYLRARRLSLAGAALAAGASDILELAMLSGYGSHQAFSRAFRSQFGTTPEAVRRAGSTLGLRLTPPFDMVDEGQANVATARMDAAGRMHFAGLLRRHSLAAMQAIPGQWQDFMPRHGEIMARKASIPVGISFNFDETGAFEYLCAAEVSRPGTLPRGLSGLDVAPQHYAVFQHEGHVATIRSTYRAIWNHWLGSGGWTAVDAPILERHHSSFNPGTGLGGLEIWIPVAKGH